MTGERRGRAGSVLSGNNRPFVDLLILLIRGGKNSDHLILSLKKKFKAYVSKCLQINPRTNGQPIVSCQLCTFHEISIQQRPLAISEEESYHPNRLDTDRKDHLKHAIISLILLGGLCFKLFTTQFHAQAV